MRALRWSSGDPMAITETARGALVEATVGPLPPPKNMVGPVAWLRQNMFSSIGNSILTLLCIYVIYFSVSSLISFLVTTAVWNGKDGSACEGESVGACWPFIKAKFGQFIYGRYPDAERWRVNLTYFLAACGLVPLMVPMIPGKKWAVLYMLLAFPLVAFLLLTGGRFGLPSVETNKWGGMLLTLVVASVGITMSFPIGVILALGRRSKMPLARWLSVGFIEFIRGVPLITILIMSNVMLPLFMAPGTHVDGLLRVLVGVSLFSGAYMAEVVRGGLQAIPRGQFEAADALGLSYGKKMGLIVLPQALKMVIPNIVSSFIGLFKDTSLVIVVGLFDLLGIVTQNMSDPKWFSPSMGKTGYFFAALMFWLFCFAMSRYSQYLERRLNTSHR
jgi:general L-amino acid transport system permease protein